MKGNLFLRTVIFWLAPALLLIIGSLFTSCGGSGDGGGAAQVPATAFPAVTLTRVASGLTGPVYLTHAGDGSGRLFVAEKRGTIRIVKNGTLLPTPFLDVSAQVEASGAEQGLLGVAFPPGYADSRHFYVDFTSRSGIGDTVIARVPVTANPDVADAAGAAAILTVRQPFVNHNGGQLAFGPDGMLYIGMGDGGSGGDPLFNAQNRTRLLGKVLRIDTESGSPTYTVPAGNPFNNEVWSYGLRNPWRFSFDRATGDLFIADVGQELFEEVNVQPAASTGGENYGWNIMEGAHCFNSPACNRTGLTLPVLEYGHGANDCSITGGYVYRGENASLRGIYFFGDFCSGRIWGMRRNGATWENKLLLESKLRISSFGEDEAGNVYVLDFGAGDIHRIDAP